ncbi:Chromate transporter [compost metagenome]
MRLFKPARTAEHDPLLIKVGYRAGLFWLSLLFALLVGLPIMSQMRVNQTLSMVDAFYRSGSLVFGGGRVVLPLLQAEVVPSDWVSNETFLAG